MISISRVFEAHPPFCEYTYLVDRLWPRGITKERLNGVIWLKEIAPSDELREWFDSNRHHWETFKQLYCAELDAHKHWQPLFELLKEGIPITLLFSCKYTEQNNAVVLREYLEQLLAKQQ